MVCSKPTSAQTRDMPHKMKARQQNHSEHDGKEKAHTQKHTEGNTFHKNVGASNRFLLHSPKRRAFRSPSRRLSRSLISPFFLPKAVWPGRLHDGIRQVHTRHPATERGAGIAVGHLSGQPRSTDGQPCGRSGGRARPRVAKTPWA